nr:prepilin-type N-terminal cleavage/methylation domain-containing protein [Lentilactobacillus kisonensis]
MKKWHRKEKSGFTLIEMTIVLFIISLPQLSNQVQH